SGAARSRPLTRCHRQDASLWHILYVTYYIQSRGIHGSSPALGPPRQPLTADRSRNLMRMTTTPSDVALVTGASGGFGTMIVKTLAAAGIRVFAGIRDHE